MSEVVSFGDQVYVQDDSDWSPGTLRMAADDGCAGYARMRWGEVEELHRWLGEWLELHRGDGQVSKP